MLVSSFKCNELQWDPDIASLDIAYIWHTHNCIYMLGSAASKHCNQAVMASEHTSFMTCLASSSLCGGSGMHACWKATGGMTDPGPTLHILLAAQDDGGRHCILNPYPEGAPLCPAAPPRKQSCCICCAANLNGSKPGSCRNEPR